MNVFHNIKIYLCGLSLALMMANAYAEPDDLMQLVETKTSTQNQVEADKATKSKTVNTPSQAATSAKNAATADKKVSKNEADELLKNAMSLLGVAYRFGGTSPSTGMDCSGFMQYIFRKTFSINLPRTSAEQAKVGTAVARSDLQVGDMVFFRTSGGNRISHVGMYVGNNRFIHAPRSGKSIEISSLSNSYWNSKYATARRVKQYNADRFTR